MACLNTLKLEIKTLEKIFTKNHERFQILNSSVDELTCRFIGKSGKRYDIHANITVSWNSCFRILVFFLISSFLSTLRWENRNFNICFAIFEDVELIFFFWDKYYSKAHKSKIEFSLSIQLTSSQNSPIFLFLPWLRESICFLRNGPVYQDIENLS